MTINELAKAVYQANKDKGFWDNERNLGEMLMLVVSELGEAIEAHRKGKFANKVQIDFIKASQDKSDAIDVFQDHVKDTFEDEIADAFIRLLDLCGGLDVKLSNDFEFEESALRFFFDKVESRNVGESLFSVVCEMSILDILPKADDFAYMIERVLAKIIGLCHTWNINIVFHVTEKLNYNSKRPKLHGKNY